MANVYVFRTSSDSKEWIWNELKNGNLRQGWGIQGSELSINNDVIPKNEWIEKYKKAALTFWNEKITDESASSRYDILALMLNIKEGDIIVVPKMPHSNTFAICEAKESYFFDFAEKKEGETYDFRHIIKIYPEKTKFFNYSSSEQAKIISSKFRAYQSALNNVWNDAFKEAAFGLQSSEGDMQKAKTLADILNEIKPDIYSQYLNRLIGLGHRELEFIVEKIFTALGYKLMDKHDYDREGGDADLVFSYDFPFFTQEFEDISTTILIQVKNKSGIDSEDYKGVEQLVKIGEKFPQAIKVLVSTTTEFTNKCQFLAYEKNVKLIDGKKLIDLAMKNL